VGFLDLMTQHYCVVDDLDECHVLDKHWKQKPSGGYQRTNIGELVYLAKPYSLGTGDRRAANDLGRAVARFVLAHPAYARADLIVPVPPSDPDCPFHLPSYLAAWAAERLKQYLSIRDGTGVVLKTRKTRPQKAVHSQQEKVENVSGAFQLVGRVRNKRVVVVDDLYQSGATINEVGRVIREGGAVEVLGLAVTKTHRNI
jgi:ATP-dependent DNA helicase RecQ